MQFRRGGSLAVVNQLLKLTRRNLRTCGIWQGLLYVEFMALNSSLLKRQPLKK